MPITVANIHNYVGIKPNGVIDCLARAASAGVRAPAGLRFPRTCSIAPRSGRHAGQPADSFGAVLLPAHSAPTPHARSSRRAEAGELLAGRILSGRHPHVDAAQAVVPDRNKSSLVVTDRFHEVQARVACSSSVSGFFDAECAVVVCNSGGVNDESRLGCVPMLAALSQNQAAAAAGAALPAGISAVFPSKYS